RGRDAQSRAFFNAPGIEWLYSGVAISTASARSSIRRSATTDGACDGPSLSLLNAGNMSSPLHSSNSVPGGSSAAAASSSKRLYDPLRRLPLIPRTRISGRPDELELGAQVALPPHGVAAIGKGQLPPHAPVAPVDGGA